MLYKVLFFMEWQVSKTNSNIFSGLFSIFIFTNAKYQLYLLLYALPSHL